ncbi:MAG: mandelate racemase/muconate lactonizing enzyme family protein [Candidatus Hadarchaeales archaeon]
MKITEVNAYPLAVPRPGVATSKPDHYLPYWKELSAAGVRSNYYACIVEIKTDEGITGYGESLVREVPEAHALIVKKLLAKIILGQDPGRVRALWEIMFSSLCTRGHFGGFFVEALSGVDAALWDILGKAKDKPVYRLLGGPTMEKIKAYASSIYWHYFTKTAPEEVAKEAVKLVEAGHDQLKIKVGASKMGGGKDADVKMIKAVRDAVGKDIEIMVDANSAFSVEEALKIGRQFEKLEVKWFEEPIPPHDVDGYVRLAKSLDMSIAGGESLFSSYTFRDFIVRGGLDVVQPNLSRCGGLTEYLRILKLCEANGVKLAPHVGLSGPGSRAAGLHASAATPKKSFIAYEYMYKQDNLLNTGLLEEPLEIFEKGYLALPKGPGLGMKLKPEKLSEFLVK